MSRRKKETSEQVEEITADAERIAAMNAYALRVKAGQSPDMTPQESIQRIQSALIGQGYEDILGLLEC